METTAGRSRRGPQPKGDRESISALIPREQRALYVRRSEELGIPFSSWVAKALAEHEGLEVPRYVRDELAKADRERRNKEAEELDLRRTA